MKELTNTKQTIVGVLLVLITFPLFSQQKENAPKYFEGIPVTNNTNIEFNSGYNELHTDSMKSMGVNLFWSGLSNEELNFLKTINTKDVNQETYQWLHYYCDAKWSQCPAAGTDDHADAGLERDLEKTLIPPGGNYVKTVPFALADTIIWSPYYTQKLIS